MIRVAIIDDHVVVRAGLRYIIEADPELEFVGEFGGGLGAADFVMFNSPDVILLDVRMPDRSGIDALKDILRVNPKARVVMLTTSDAEEDVFRAIEEGALGYVMKESEVAVISAAIRSAMAGEVYMTDDVRKIYETRKGSKGLSTREAQVLKVAAKGANNKEIAKELGLSENSVKMFLKRAFFKLGASNRAEAVQLAVKRGLIEAGFTLVEMLVVVTVIVTLVSIVFRLSSIGGDSAARSTTITRMQRLENCISGYYAAFGSYPPVKLHGNRGIYYKVNDYGIQQVENDDPDPSELVWERVEAACRSQPVGMNFPFPSYMGDYVKKVSETLTELHNNGDEDSPYVKNPALANRFDALDEPSMLSAKYDEGDWAACQVFRFGLMSFLLPRYLVMMGHDDDDLYRKFAQWNNNNQLPCRFEDGSPYRTWAELNAEVKQLGGGRQNGNAWKVEALASQAVTARWMPNLEGILRCERDLKLYGVTVSGDGGRNVCISNPNPILYTAADSQSGENSSSGGAEQYALDGVTCCDGWKNEFYYYSAPPYQSYRLWSAGPNGMTFPPWISQEEIERDKTLSGERKRIENWLADDIVHMSN